METIGHEPITHPKTTAGTESAESVIVRIGASTTGLAFVGGAVGSIFGPAGSGVGTIVGGVIGLAASASDVVRSQSEK